MELFQVQPVLLQYRTILVYGTDQGSIYICEEMRKKGIIPTAYLQEEAIHQIDSDIPVWDKNQIEDISAACVVFPFWNKKIFEDIGKMGLKHIFVYGTFYQTNLILENEMKDISVLPFFQINEEVKKRDIVIYGVGEVGHRLFMELLNYEVRVKYFCDSNADFIGLKLMNKPILSMEDLKRRKDSCNVIIGSVDYADEIEKQLLENGIENIYQYNG